MHYKKVVDHLEPNLMSDRERYLVLVLIHELRVKLIYMDLALEWV